LAVLSTAPTPVCTAQPTTQATSSGTSAAIFTAPLAGVTTYWAKAPTPKPRYTHSAQRDRPVVPSRNVFVWIKYGLPRARWTPPAESAKLDQVGCIYEPHVLGIMVGQDLHVISSDATTHNIHPMPKDNREWNQSQAPGAAPIDEKFTRPEIMIPVKCNQHPWMKAYLGVTKSPLYAVTNADGTFTIKGVPPGDYTIGAWTATFGQQETKVTVPAKGSATADFTFKAGS
jgi:hypothetical protein